MNRAVGDVANAPRIWRSGQYPHDQCCRDAPWKPCFNGAVQCSNVVRDKGSCHVSTLCSWRNGAFVAVYLVPHMHQRCEQVDCSTSRCTTARGYGQRHEGWQMSTCACYATLLASHLHKGHGVCCCCKTRPAGFAGSAYAARIALMLSYAHPLSCVLTWHVTSWHAA